MGEGCGDSICLDKPPTIKSLTGAQNLRYLTRETSLERSLPDRPLYRTEFGPKTWRLLHRMTLWFPEASPSVEEKALMNNIIKGISKFFPCKECAEHFKEEIIKDPPKLSNRNELVQWMCIQHNNVNKRLMKSEFDCSNVETIQRFYKL